MACLSLLDYLGELGGAARLGWAGALLLKVSLALMLRASLAWLGLFTVVRELAFFFEFTGDADGCFGFTTCKLSHFTIRPWVVRISVV